MKFETLAKRIAERVNYPPLEDALLGRGKIKTLECLTWPGKKTSSGYHMKRIRDRGMRPYISPVWVDPYPLIQYQGKTQYVHRLVFEIIGHELEGYQLKNICGNTLCINPFHWEAKPLGTTSPATSPEELEIPEQWTFEEAEEAVEVYLEDHDEINLGHELLEDIPPELLHEVLVKLNKDHLV